MGCVGIGWQLTIDLWFMVIIILIMGALQIGQGVVQFYVMTVLELKPVIGSNFGVCHK